MAVMAIGEGWFRVELPHIPVILTTEGRKNLYPHYPCRL